MRDASSKDRLLRPCRATGVRLTREQRFEIFDRRQNNGESAPSLAKLFGVTPEHIYITSRWVLSEQGKEGGLGDSSTGV